MFASLKLTPRQIIATVTAVVTLLVANASSCIAQDEELAQLSPEQQQMIALYASIDWQAGPATVDIGSNAQITIPEGFQFTGRQGSIAWNTLTQNPPDGTLGILMPTADDQDWFLAFHICRDGHQLEHLLIQVDELHDGVVTGHVLEEQLAGGQVDLLLPAPGRGQEGVRLTQGELLLGLPPGRCLAGVVRPHHRVRLLDPPAVLLDLLLQVGPTYNGAPAWCPPAPALTASCRSRSPSPRGPPRSA